VRIPAIVTPGSVHREWRGSAHRERSEATLVVVYLAVAFSLRREEPLSRGGGRVEDAVEHRVGHGGVAQVVVLVRRPSPSSITTTSVRANRERSRAWLPSARASVSSSKRREAIPAFTMGRSPLHDGLKPVGPDGASSGRHMRKGPNEAQHDPTARTRSPLHPRPGSSRWVRPSEMRVPERFFGSTHHEVS